MVVWDLALAKFLHVTAAVLWVGGGALQVMFIAPTAGRTGPDALPFMRNLLTDTRLADYLTGLGLTTILTGLYLYWQLGHHLGAFASIGTALLSVGALAGILAGVVGIGMMRPRIAELGEILDGLGEGPPDADTQERMQTLQEKLRTYGMVFLTLSLIALVGMGMFRYV